MPKVTFLDNNKKVDVRVGETLLQAASRARVAITQRCRGNAACAMCKVTIKNMEQNPLTPPEEKERRLISDEQLAQGMRLACQARVIGNVEIAPTKNKLQSIVQAQLERQKRESEF